MHASDIASHNFLCTVRSDNCKGFCSLLKEVLSVQRGLVSALGAEGRAVAAAHQEQSAAWSSDRASLTREAVEAEQAAELLHTAEGMLRAQPESHAASCSRVEVRYWRLQAVQYFPSVFSISHLCLASPICQDCQTPIFSPLAFHCMHMSSLWMPVRDSCMTSGESHTVHTAIPACILCLIWC